MSTMIADRTYRIARENTQAMIIDVQERLTPYIYDHENIVKKTVTIIKGLQALGIPIMLNEQYKKGLGDSLPELRDVLEGDNAKSFEKVTFSACDNNDTWHHLAQQNRSTVLLIGVEAHVCVLQTALDLLDNGMQPVIIGDAVGSRFPYDKKQAIRRIRRAGGIISTVETILFELCRSSEDPAFKTILNLIK
ncbi:hydrolase [Psychrobacter sp. C 20.9]|uniref:isochorismatase family protein n=1 Tax=Psychrobacter sp. C 20.9 TaxID=1926477 RepID=UPI000946DF36|nr:isochorismatase family protein [Psychrobacter sp. C 20.9]OLF35133.1 hydrolase [Psychrobacter sp. C 20.9]